MVEPRCAEVALRKLDSVVTPTPRHFVRSHFPAPRRPVAGWRVRFDGLLERPTDLTVPRLQRFPRHEVVATMECAGNSRSSITPRTKGVRWQHGAVGTARWSGVALGDVLDFLGVRPGATEVVLEGADRGDEEGRRDIPYAMSVSLDKARAPETLIAFRMNGRPLSRDHGAPVRVIVPGWYGMASVKWLVGVRVQDRPFDGFFRAESYVMVREGHDPAAPKPPVTRLLVKSLITTPAEHTELPTGPLEVRGFAWSGGSGVARVDVSYAPLGTLDDDLAWRPATLAGADGPYAWRPWETTVEIERPGYYLLRARATDLAGAVQPLHPSWNYRGVSTNAVHAVSIVVRGRPGSTPPASPERPD